MTTLNIDIAALAARLLAAVRPSGPAEYDDEFGPVSRHFLAVYEDDDVAVVSRHRDDRSVPESVWAGRTAWFQLPDSFRTPTPDEAISIAAAIAAWRAGENCSVEAVLSTLDTREMYPTDDWWGDTADAVRAMAAAGRTASEIAAELVDRHRDGDTIIVVDYPHALAYVEEVLA